VSGATRSFAGPPVACPAREELVNPFVFVVGAARSGTTLLQRMLDAHPLLAVVNETYWLPRKFRERKGLTREGLVTASLLPLLLESAKFSRMELDNEDLTRLLPEEEPVRYERFVARIFDAYAARRGKPLAGDKTPGYVRRMARIHELWPRARFIHIVRDPRDVYLSMVDWRGGERTAGQYGTWHLDPAASTALYWRLSVALGREAGEELGADLYHEVRYEDLVQDPERALEDMCAFLGLPYAQAMVRFHEGRTRVKAGRSSKAQWLPPTAGLRDWQAQLDAHEIARIEAAVGGLLVDAGYRARYGCPDIGVRERVAHVRDLFTDNALARDRTLPRDWDRC
jgi:hypothetical protein